MLAGNVKLKNFLMVAGVVGIAGVVGLYFACRGGDDGEKTAETQPPPPSDPKPVAQPTPPPVTTSPPVTTPPPLSNLRDVDKALLGWKGKNLGSDKKKDATKGRPFKVNLYQDAGHAVMNRAKIDLDRDDKWDEKWTFDGDNITRQVAPNDDENYTLTFHWTGTDWKPAD